MSLHDIWCDTRVRGIRTHRALDLGISAPSARIILAAFCGAMKDADGRVGKSVSCTVGNGIIGGHQLSTADSARPTGRENK